MELDCIGPVAPELVLVYMQQMDHLYSLVGMSSSVYDLRQHNLPVAHKYLRMDQHICYLNMLLMDYIQYSLYILDDNRCMDPQSNLWHMYKLHYRILHCCRMDLDHMDYMVLVEVFQLFLCIAWMDHQCNEVDRYKWVCGFECDTLKNKRKRNIMI